MSNLQYIDMQSTINLAIIGISTLLGLAAGKNREEFEDTKGR
jgi:hypothetical protein